MAADWHEQWPWSTFIVIIFSYICVKISIGYFFWILIESLGIWPSIDDIADDLQWPFNLFQGHFSDTINCFVSQIIRVSEVSYNGRTSYVNNYFYCRFRPEELLYDAERYLSAIACFLVCNSVRWNKTPAKENYGNFDLLWVGLFSCSRVKFDSVTGRYNLGDWTVFFGRRFYVVLEDGWISQTMPV